MPSGVPPTLAELASAARSCPAARDALARAVLPAARAKARKYAKKFAPDADADDLLSAGVAKFDAALASYDPAKGSFLNYFLHAACRAMVARATAAAKTPRAVGVEFDEREGRPDDDPDAVDALDALARLPPADRLIFAAVTQIARNPAKSDGKKAGDVFKSRTDDQIGRVAKALYAAPADVQAVCDRAAARLRKTMAGDGVPGRPPDPARRALADAARRLRLRGLTWKQVARELSGQYGRKISRHALQMLLRRTK